MVYARQAQRGSLSTAGTDHEIMAWGGWSSLKEVQRYTKAANRKRLAPASGRQAQRWTDWLTSRPG